MAGKNGPKQIRVTKALQWHYFSDKTQKEIADELGVSEQKVREYINETPTGLEVKEQLDRKEAEVRSSALDELREQSREASAAAREPDRIAPVWRNDDGDLEVRNVVDEETGEVVDLEPVKQDLEIVPDQKIRSFRRQEVREIIEAMSKLVGIEENYSIEHTGEDGGPLEVTFSDTVVTTNADDSPEDETDVS